jgi:PAS domain-containing protein
MPAFICPKCGHRESSSGRHVGHQPRGCSKCGFGFLFELLEDYYASPTTGLIACDQDRRILVAGRATAAITGYSEEELLGREVMERLGITGYAGDDPAARTLEWGVRVLALECSFQPKGASRRQKAVADFFPAYDDDGGLLLALTPR